RARAGTTVARPRAPLLPSPALFHSVRARARTHLTRVGLRAGVAVGAGAAVGLGGVRARAGTRVARPRVVTLVGCGADDGVPARASDALACVRPPAGVPVGALAAVGL